MRPSRAHVSQTLSQPLLSLEEVQKKHQEGVLFIDVRTLQEVAGGKLQGALHIPHDQIAQRIDELPEPSKEIVLYCGTGPRADFALQVLEANQFTNVHNAGGYPELQAIVPIET